jgi:hypothetical protein
LLPAQIARLLVFNSGRRCQFGNYLRVTEGYWVHLHPAQGDGGREFFFLDNLGNDRPPDRGVKREGAPLSLPPEKPMKPESRLSSEQGLANAVNLAGNFDHQFTQTPLGQARLL